MRHVTVTPVTKISHTSILILSTFVYAVMGCLLVLQETDCLVCYMIASGYALQYRTYFCWG